MGFGRYRFRRSFGQVKSQFRGATPSKYPNYAGWPQIADDNALTDKTGDTTTGWIPENSTYTSNGTYSTLSIPSGTSGGAVTPVDDPSAGEYISYFKVRCDRVVGGFNSIAFRLGASSSVIVSIGYNWATGSVETQRVSMGVRDGGLTGVQGPSIDHWSGEGIEVAVTYSAIHNGVNLFVKVNGLWKYYGGATTTRPEFDGYQLFGSGTAGNVPELDMYYMMTARPNIVATGSSITAGRNSFDPDPSVGLKNFASNYEYYIPPSVYPDLRNNLVFNSGFAGEDTNGLLTRLATLAPTAQARLYLMEANANDFGSNTTLTQRTQNLNDATDIVTANGGQSILLNTIYPSGASGDYYAEWWEDYRTQVTDVLGYVDWIQVLLGQDGYNDPQYFSDGVHPTVEGYSLAGAEINRLIPITT